MTTTPTLLKSATLANTTTAGDQFESQLAALPDDGYLVVWRDLSRTHNAAGDTIVGQRFDAAGNKVGGEINIGFNNGDQTHAAITRFPNGNLAVAFVDTFAGDQDIYVRVYNSSLGLIRLDNINLGPNQTFNPSITALGDGSYFVSYTIGSGADAILGRIVSASGVVGPQFVIDEQINHKFDSSEVATLSNGNVVMVDTDELNGTTDIKFQILTPTEGQVAGPSFVFGGAGAGSETDPHVAALRDGGFVAVWTDPDGPDPTDIRATLYSNDGTVNVGFRNVLVNTSTNGFQDSADVLALADGGFLVSWLDHVGFVVRAQRFDAAGHQIGSEFIVQNDFEQSRSPDAATLADGRIAYAVDGFFSGANDDVVTSIYTIGPTPPPPAGTSADMILRRGDGTYEVYDIGNNSLLAAYQLGQIGTDWTFVGLGGFLGSDTTDMVSRSASTGGFEVYDIANNNITSAAFLGTVGMDWQVMGFGNFSSLGETDMILRNANTGGFEVYDISNNQITNAAFMGTVGLNWQFSGVGNFSGRGTSDMMLRNSNTGGLEVYDINNNQITGAAFIGTVGVDWQFSGVGNFSGVAGETDLLLRNVNTGGLEVYDINNNQLTGAAFLGTVGLDWQFAGIAPIHAPGASDLVLRNANTGAFEVYDIANNQITGAAALGSVGLDWQLGGFAADPPTSSIGSSGSTSSAAGTSRQGFVP
jgi:hypothetical protein